MANIVPFGNGDSLLPSLSSDRQLRKAARDIDRQATLIEAVAMRKFAMASALNQSAKVQIAASVGYSKHLAEFVPEAEPLFRALDLQTAQSLSDTMARALR